MLNACVFYTMWGIGPHAVTASDKMRGGWWYPEGLCASTSIGDNKSLRLQREERTCDAVERQVRAGEGGR